MFFLGEWRFVNYTPSVELGRLLTQGRFFVLKMSVANMHTLDVEDDYSEVVRRRLFPLSTTSLEFVRSRVRTGRIQAGFKEVVFAVYCIVRQGT